jgi:hypothetical protein
MRAGESWDTRRLLTVVPLIWDKRYYGEETARRTGGPRDGRVQGWRNRWLEVWLFGAPSWLRMGRSDAGYGQTAKAGAPTSAEFLRRVLEHRSPARHH